MYTALTILWTISAFIVIWAMAGYPIFLVIIQKVFKKQPLKRDASYQPNVTVMVVAHNEEKVILEKLNNLISLDYPRDKLEIMVTSDFSTDRTNSIVEDFIREHPERIIRLHKTVNHGGKTNAQNEAQKFINSEILIMTDANCIFRKDAVKELVSVFSDSSIAYVCGSTVFTNSLSNATASSESTYWDLDSKCRDIESRFQTITAGDGNIYACRNAVYEDIPLIECHDSSFPVRFALKGYRAVYQPNAIAYEKSGENDTDEYKRKVRMNRNLFHNILPSLKILNIFKYKWFTVFWLGHRTCRYLLWLAHLLLILISGCLCFSHWFWRITLGLQVVFYLVAIYGRVFNIQNSRVIKLVTYYAMTVLSQWHGVYNIITGKAKPTWTKAETTR